MKLKPYQNIDDGKLKNNSIDEVLKKIKTSIDHVLYGPRNINRNNSETSEHQQILNDDLHHDTNPDTEQNETLLFDHHCDTRVDLELMLHVDGFPTINIQENNVPLNTPQILKKENDIEHRNNIFE